MCVMNASDLHVTKEQTGSVPAGVQTELWFWDVISHLRAVCLEVNILQDGCKGTSDLKRTVSNLLHRMHAVTRSHGLSFLVGEYKKKQKKQLHQLLL